MEEITVAIRSCGKKENTLLQHVARVRKAKNISFMDHVPKEFAEKMRVPYEGIVAEKEAIITQLQPALKALRQKQNTWVDTASALRLQVDALQSRHAEG